MEQLIKEFQSVWEHYQRTPESEEKLVAFIRHLLELPQKKRKELMKPVIQAACHSKKAGKPLSSDVLLSVAWVCISLSKIRSLYLYIYDIPSHLLLRVTTLYCPTWLPKFISEWNYFSYYDLMWLMDNGYVSEIRPEEIARTLPNSIRIPNEDWKAPPVFDTDRLLRHPVTLQEHIFLLFEYETNIDYIDSSAADCHAKGQTAKDERIAAALCRFSMEGKVDRQRLLKANLAAFGRGFKRDLSGWMADCFETLQPTPEELVELQEEMMQALTSPHSKVVNVMLKQLKRITKEKTFRYAEIVDHTAPLFFSAPKNSLLTIHALYEEIVRQHPEMKELCCTTLCQLFLKKDETLQKRAADFIAKHRDPESLLLQQTLETYRPELLQSVLPLLESFTENRAEANEEVSTAASLLPICRENNRIAPPENKDDFLFYISRLLSTSDSWERDTAIAALVTFYPQLNAEDRTRMEVVFQQARKLQADFSAYTYDRLVAALLLEYQQLWQEREQPSTDTKRSIFSRMKERLGQSEKERSPIDKDSFTPIRLTDWQVRYSTATCFEPIRQMWLNLIARLRQGKTLPVLSAPTHTPAYIEPAELVRRLHCYQEADVRPCPWDLQLAIARCALDTPEAGITAARKLLKDEYLHLCLFLLDRSVAPEPPYKHPEAWIAAGVVKEPQTVFKAFDSFACNRLPHADLTGNYQWEAPIDKPNNYEGNRKLLRPNISRQYASVQESKVWQEYLHIKSDFGWEDSKYLKPLLCCCPNRPEPLIARVVAHYLAFEAPTEDSKRCVSAALSMLLAFHAPLGEMSLLLLAGSLLFADRTARSYAAELWVEGLSAGRIDNRRVGEILARLIGMELGPLKRFITQIYESMYKRSAFHNQQLEELLTIVISQLPEQPVTGLKQLLELYAELLTLNGSASADDTLLQRLQAWSGNSNLKKVVAGLLTKATVDGHP